MFVSGTPVHRRIRHSSQRCAWGTVAVHPPAAQTIHAPERPCQTVAANDATQDAAGSHHTNRVNARSIQAASPVPTYVSCAGSVRTLVAVAEAAAAGPETRSSASAAVLTQCRKKRYTLSATRWCSAASAASGEGSLAGSALQQLTSTATLQLRLSRSSARAAGGSAPQPLRAPRKRTGSTRMGRWANSSLQCAYG